MDARDKGVIGVSLHNRVMYPLVRRFRSGQNDVFNRGRIDGAFA